MNSTPSTIDTIKTIQTTQRKISLGIGVTMGMLLIVYFFTFAMFLDRGMTVLYRFEIISSIIFFVAFFFLNKISYTVTRIFYARRKPHQEVFNHLKSNDSSKDPEEISARMNI